MTWSIQMRVASAVAVMVALLAVTLVSGDVPVASADAGPHGGYTATGGTQGGLPDQCAGCHRVHQGQSVGKLLKAASPFALCLTCHNGSGSVLDVLDGIRLTGLVAPAAGTIRQADSGTLTASIAPVADVSIPAGEEAFFRLAIRNTAGAVSATITLGPPAGDTAQFGAAYLDRTPGTSVLVVPLAAAPSVTYVDISVPSNLAAPGGSTITLPVDIAATGSNPVVVLSARVRDAADAVAVGNNGALMGGGFMFVDGKAVTSRHNADPADNSLNPWGYNANTGQNTNSLTSALQCTSCHNPHGSANYRILKEQVNGQAVNVKAFFDGTFTKQEGARGLEVGAPADKYVKEYYGSSGGAENGGKGDPGIGSLCGACHTAYPSNGASAPYTAGGVTHFRHKTEMPYTEWTNPDNGRTSQNPETNPIQGTQQGQTGNFPALRLASNSIVSNAIVQCLTCHRVHGSSSTMDGYALKPSVAAVTGGTGLADEDLTPSQTTSDHTGNLSVSSLLFTNNRGMCQACHQWGVVD